MGIIILKHFVKCFFSWLSPWPLILLFCFDLFVENILFYITESDLSIFLEFQKLPYVEFPTGLLGASREDLPLLTSQSKTCLPISFVMGINLHIRPYLLKLVTQPLKGVIISQTHVNIHQRQPKLFNGIRFTSSCLNKCG